MQMDASLNYSPLQSKDDAFIPTMRESIAHSYGCCWVDQTIERYRALSTNNSSGQRTPDTNGTELIFMMVPQLGVPQLSVRSIGVRQRRIRPAKTSY